MDSKSSAQRPKSPAMAEAQKHCPTQTVIPNKHLPYNESPKKRQAHIVKLILEHIKRGARYS
jgi:hypothetical protein